MDRQSWFHSYAHDVHVSGITITLRAPGTCCPYNVNHTGRIHSTQGPQGRWGAIQEGECLRWVPFALQCLRRVKILGAELEKEQMATKLRKAVT